MKRLLIFWFCLPLLASDYVPNRYIVELSHPSIAARARALHTAAAEQQRSLVRAQQSAVRRLIERGPGKVVGQVENVSNALIVEIPDADAAQLTSIAGVAKVHPVRMFHLFLDHALALHRVTGAWNQIGIPNAGAGMKIAIIDTGIEIGHPGFSDAAMAAPAGYPLADSPADLPYTNNKVIVARSYANYFTNAEPDRSVADHVGHGTATAMAAAGVMTSGPLATISGVAPRAYLGVYKVFGTPGVNDNAPEDAILRAIDDAVNDGMDVINMSLGTNVAMRLEDDPEVQALQHASAMGVIAVVSAGNNGPDPATIGSPAATPSAIAVGASNNDRYFAGTLQLPEGKSLAAMPAASITAPPPVAAPLADVATLDGTGLACAALPPNSLSGTIALIFRGTCTFETKLNNAQAAGAVGATVYDNVPGEDPITMAVGAATLPAGMISNSDGLQLRQLIAKGLTGTLDFTPAPAYTNPARIASFSARGPNVDLGIKPDLLAVGSNLYTAAQTLDSNGALYNPSGFSVEQGTSFSAPIVAGASALLKAARPGLTVDQYRSLLIHSAAPASLSPGTTAGIQQAGGGVLDLLASLNATAAVAPVSLSFAVGGDSVDGHQVLTLTNVGTVSDTFQLSVAPHGGSAAAPQLPFASVQLDPGASTLIPLSFTAGPLVAGAYEGYINIQGTQSSIVSHIPYWYGVASNQPGHITILDGANGAHTAGARVGQAVVFRVSDAAGLPVAGIQPAVTAVTAGARATNLTSLDSVVPNAFTFDARLSTQPGPNVFQIQAGGITATVTIVGQ